MVKVNLDALIPREDFEIKSSQEIEASISPSFKINELEAGRFFVSALRKPDFQRETAEWDPPRVVQLIKTFVEGDLIPGLILWKHRELLFVIDGSHRLSALIAWVQDDYGDGKSSRAFFDSVIPEEQREIAERTRELVEKEIGTYASHVHAAGNPEEHSPETVLRARRMASLSVQLQWVQGGSAKAEASFIRINQQAAKITPEELELIENRRLPNVIAARAIIRRATGHQYWSAFTTDTQNQIKDLSVEIHKLLFEPYPKSGQRSSDLAAGGSTYSSTALRMVYDFINLCIGTPSNQPDEDGSKTIEYLKRCRKVMQLMLSTDPSSLGLHPAIYFYSWTAKQQPMQFLVTAELAMSMSRDRALPNFIKQRAELETYLIQNRTVLQQIVRKYGTKDAGRKRLLTYLRDILKALSSGVKADGVAAHLRESADYKFLQPEEALPFESAERAGFSKGVKAGAIMRELVKTAIKCPECDGLVPIQAVSIDHRVRLADGGMSIAANAQVSHPYCNSGVKESRVARTRDASHPPT